MTHKQLIEKLLHDPTYEGGVQYWIQKHDAQLLENARLRNQIDNLLKPSRAKIANERDALRAENKRLKRRARPSKKKVMAVLDRVLAEGGYKITVRAYNSILTGLGYALANDQFGEPLPGSTKSPTQGKN